MEKIVFATHYPFFGLLHNVRIYASERYAKRVSRRADGELEREILSVLWTEDQPLQATQVREKLDLDLAYTSVATVLTRMWEKGWVSREPSGRAFVYCPTMSRADWYAEKMLAVLDQSPNQRALLAGFVGKLSKRDRQALKKLLTEDGPG